MKTIKLHNKNFTISIPNSEILRSIDVLAQRVNADYGYKSSPNNNSSSDDNTHLSPDTHNLTTDSSSNSLQNSITSCSDSDDNNVPILIGILNGSFMFCSELMQRLNFDCQLCFVKVKSYSGTHSDGSVEQIIGLNIDISGRDVIIVEDIVETGGTIEHVHKLLMAENPRSINIATLFFKNDVYKKSIPIKYFALPLKNDFIVGFGLDYDGLGRNYKDIYVIEE